MGSLVVADPYAGLPAADAAWLRGRAGALDALYRRSAADVVEMGAILAAVRGRLTDERRYLAWCAAELPFSYRTADRMIHAAGRFAGSADTVSTFAPTALYILAQPSTPDGAREKALELAAAGHRITKAAAVNLVRLARRGGLAGGDPGGDPAPPRPPDPVSAALHATLPGGSRRVLGPLWVRRDPDGDLVVGVGTASARVTPDGAAALAGLLGQFAAVPPRDYREDPHPHLGWAEQIARGVAMDARLPPGSQEEHDLMAVARDELLDRCCEFDPGGNPGVPFRAWAKLYIWKQCDRRREDFTSGGTYRNSAHPDRPRRVESYTE